MSDTKVLINTGTRTWDLKAGPDGKKRQVLPGQSIQTLDDDEAKALLNHFRDWKDAANVVPANATRIASMQAEIDRLTAENSKLSGPKGHKAEAEEESKHKEKKGK